MVEFRWRSTQTTSAMQPAQLQSCEPRSKILKESKSNKCSQVTELENKLISNNKELHAAQDLNQALQHEYKETMAQKEDQVNQPPSMESPIMLLSGGEDSDPGEEVPQLTEGGDAVARLERAG